MPAFGEQHRDYYPGMIPLEQRMFRIWLREHEQEFDRFEYDVHVGAGVTSQPGSASEDPEIDARVREQFRRATQKRIDAVGWQGPITWIFEVHERAGTRELGQLALYEILLPRSVSGVGQIEKALITTRIGADMLEAFQAAGVLVYQVSLEL